MNPSRQLTARDPVADSRKLSDRIMFFNGMEPLLNTSATDKNRCDLEGSGRTSIPIIESASLDAQCLAHAIATSGALIVKGLFKQEEVVHLRFLIDKVVDSSFEKESEATEIGKKELLYRNPPEAIKSKISPHELRMSRYFHRESGSAMCIESASVAEHLLEIYTRKGLKVFIQRYLNEAPCLSALKWVLRRSKLPISRAGWHQDGAFMGKDINSLNMWLPLNACGGETGSPGLDVVPRRLSELFTAGGDSAAFDWSVGERDLIEKFGENCIVSPEFEAGDAFFFDHFYLHRTQYREDFHTTRYAIETWFFGCKNFPANQIPLRW